MDKENLAIIRQRAESWSKEPRAVTGDVMPEWHTNPTDVNDLLSLADDALKLLDEIERQ